MKTPQEFRKLIESLDEGIFDKLKGESPIPSTADEYEKKHQGQSSHPEHQRDWQHIRQNNPELHKELVMRSREQAHDRAEVGIDKSFADLQRALEDFHHYAADLGSEAASNDMGEAMIQSLERAVKRIKYESIPGSSNGPKENS